MNSVKYGQLDSGVELLPRSIELVDNAILDDDEALVNMANKARLSLPSAPPSSIFRVYALLVVNATVERGERRCVLVHGTNTESRSFIGASICAERAALTQLRFLRDPTIERVIVVTDNEEPISPGLLCREYLSSLADLNTTVVMAGCDGGKSITKCTLGELYPFPLIYRRSDRTSVMTDAQLYASTIAKRGIAVESIKIFLAHLEDLQVGASKVFKAAFEHTQHDAADLLHPLRLAAALMFDNGTIEAAVQLKGLEYGCTLDPVSQLLREMRKHQILCAPCTPTSSSSSSLPPTPFTHSSSPPSSSSSSSSLDASYCIKPAVLIMVDQFGVCHAPNGQSRALMTEYGNQNL